MALLDVSSAALARQRPVTISGVPDGANVLVTPVFASGSTVISLVMAITVPADRRLIRKADPRTGGEVSRWATTWRSHHVLAYFDQRSGGFAGPFHLADEPSLALSTAAASGSDLFLWTTREPQPGDPAGTRARALLSRVSAFPLGSGKARFSCRAPPHGRAGSRSSRFRRVTWRAWSGRDVQVCSAGTER